MDAKRPRSIEREGYDRESGARPLRRAIQRPVENELSRRVLGGKVDAGDRLVVDARQGELSFHVGAGYGRRSDGGGRAIRSSRELMRSTVTLGLIVAPRLERDVPAELAGQLAEDLARRHPSVDWRTELVVDRLVESPARVIDIREDARRRLLRSHWHLAIVVTDLPLRNNGKPVSRRASRTHGVGVVSLPALGPLHVRPRLRRELVGLVDELLGRVDREADDVLRELTARNAERVVILRPLFVTAVLFSHLRLLLGMVRANRPWRLVGRLYAALIAALAVGAYGVVTSDIWRLSIALDWWRLTITSAASIAITIATVIIVPGLWERTSDSRVRGQVVLFNLATATTVTVGIVSLYAVLFLGILAGAVLVTAPETFAQAVGRHVGFADYVTLAWFVASLATIGGALGSALESEDAVRAAAYASSATETDDATEHGNRR